MLNFLLLSVADLPIILYTLSLKNSSTLFEKKISRQTNVKIELQHITYSQWLPHVIGERLTMQMGLAPAPKGHNPVYDPNTDPSVSNVFGAVAFRFGHTLLQNTVLFMKDQGMHIRNEMAFNRPGMIFT